MASTVSRGDTTALDLLQEKVLAMLYDSLSAPGYLVLGEAETLTNSLRGKLDYLDARAKIYRKSRGRW